MNPIEYIQNKIAPQLEELGPDYAILIQDHHNKFCMYYSGDIVSIAYMMGQTLRDMIETQPNGTDIRETLLTTLGQGLEDPIEDTSE